MMTSSGAGEPLPMMLIIKCAATAADQSRTRVVTDLQKEEPFARWTSGQWEREVELPKRGGGVSKVKHVRPYLLDPINGHLLLAHHKAWNDAIGASPTL